MKFNHKSARFIKIKRINDKNNICGNNLVLLLANKHIFTRSTANDNGNFFGRQMQKKKKMVAATMFCMSLGLSHVSDVWHQRVTLASVKREGKNPANDLFSKGPVFFSSFLLTSPRYHCCCNLFRL